MSEDCSVPGLVQVRLGVQGLGRRGVGSTQNYKTCLQWIANDTVLQVFSDDACIFTPALIRDNVL